jgi:hypothetical protein
MSSVIQMEICEATHGTSLYPVNHMYSDIQAGYGDRCTLQPGNSGSPVIAGSEAVGIQVAINADDPESRREKEDYKSTLTAYSLKEDVELPDPLDIKASVLTNFACIDIKPEVGAPPKPAECEPRKRAEMDKFNKRRFDYNGSLNMKKDEESILKTFLESNGPRPFRFSGETVEEQVSKGRFAARIDMQLECLKPKEQWPAGSFTLDRDVLRIQYTAPVSSYRYALDKVTRLYLKKTGEAQSQVSMVIDLKKTSKRDGYIGTQSVLAPGATSAVTTQIYSRWCQ